MIRNRLNKWMIPVVVALLAIAFVSRMIYEDLTNAMVSTVMLTLRNIIHLSLLFTWVMSLERRLVNKKVRRLMLTVGGLMIFWLLDKIVKWDYTGSVTHPLVRYLWYGFYVGMLFIPTLGAFIINYLGKPEHYSHPRKLNLLLIVPTVLLACVFTNDLHQKVFVFYNGFEKFNKEYGYGWIYYIVMGWFIVMGFYFVVMMLVKSRVPGSRKLRKMPILIMVFAALFWVGYSMRLYDCDLTVMDILIIVLLLESALQSGLLPSNSKYRELFDMTTIPVQVVDRDYQPHYVSAGALPIPEEQLRRTETGTVNRGNTLLSSEPIHGGRVVWEDDITQINSLQQQLREARDQLSEENVLLQAELDLKEQRAKTDEKNRLYDRIAQEVEPELIKIDQLLQRIPNEPENADSLLAKICVLGSYIKRRGNLLLLGEDGYRISARELEYCIRESLDNLRLNEVFTALNAGCTGETSLDHIVAAYDFYQSVTEELLDQITAMMVNLYCDGSGIRMNIQMGCREEISGEAMEGIVPTLGTCSYEIMDEDVVIDLTIGEEGDGNNALL